MTNQEIIDMQRRNRRLTERSKTIVADLRARNLAIMHDAAEIIEWLIAENSALRHVLNKEIIEGQRQAGDAYAQGQQDEHDKNRLA